jgi:excisionase family DNA binding protein
MSDPPLVLTVEEAADVLRISRGSAYEAIRANEIPHIRIGRTIRVPRAALLGLLSDAPTEDHLDREQHAGQGRERRDQGGGAAS